MDHLNYIPSDFCLVVASSTNSEETVDQEKNPAGPKGFGIATPA